MAAIVDLLNYIKQLLKNLESLVWLTWSVTTKK